MDDSVWRLPGPERLIRQIANEVQRGRHVGVVLPSARAGEEMFVDGLVTGLMRTLSAVGEEPRRGRMSEPGTDPLRALAECLVFGDELPVVVADLLDHEDAAGRTAVLDCTAPPPEEHAPISAMLARIAVESRPRPAARRPRVVVIGRRETLPPLGGGSVDVTFEAVWWWGRLSRWDIASRLAPEYLAPEYLAPEYEARGGQGVLREVQLETILEVCRWDLDLAEYLTRAWDGEPGTLAAEIKSTGWVPPGIDTPLPRSGRAPEGRPPDDMVELWDLGGVELWRSEYSPSPYQLLTFAGAVEHAVWAAQTRVLLPWIEVQRRALLNRLAQRFGGDAVQVAVQRQAWGDGPVEVRALYWVTKELVPAGDRALLNAARWMMNARNKLAHLDCLSTADQRQLVQACHEVSSA